MVICETDWGLTIALLLVLVAWNLFRFGWILLCAVGFILLCKNRWRLGVALLGYAIVWFVIAATIVK